MKKRPHETIDQQASEILQYWFGDDGGNDKLIEQRSQFWFGKSEQTDREIKSRFQDDVERLIAGNFDHWLVQPEGRLACIILIDQFCRQIYRDTAQAFKYDSLALSYCLDGIMLKHDVSLTRPQRSFYYLPLEHSESLEDQDLSVAKFQALADDAPIANKPAYEYTLDYALRHRQVIERFGRFPHRNRILGRPSAPEETEFLKQPGSSF